MTPAGPEAPAGQFTMSDAEYLRYLQWPAMIVTIIAAWLIASQSMRRRMIGFWTFLVSNVLWMVWAWDADAYALIALQIALAFLNFRGVYKNEPTSPGVEGSPLAQPEHWRPPDR